MAVYFSTTTPQTLLNAFKKAIDDKHIVTWGYDADGDFTHTAEQWKAQAWFRPLIKSGSLRFTIMKRKDSHVSPVVYAIYHGRLIETMLAHFDTVFTDGVATAKAQSDDMIS